MEVNESVDSSQQYENDQKEKFDSAMDLYSEHSDRYYRDLDI